MALRMRLLLPILAALFLVLGISGSVSFNLSKTQIEELVANKGRSLSVLMQNLARIYIANFELSTLDRLVEHSQKDPDIAYMAFYDPKGKLLTEASAIKNKSADQLVFTDDIKEADGQVIGRVEIGYRRTAIEAAVRNSILTTAATLLASLLIVGIAVFVVATKASRKIEQLTNILQSATMETGESSGKIKGISSDLNDAATEQSQALQTVASTLNELEAMISRTSQNTLTCQETAKDCQVVVGNGQQAITQVIGSMKGISENSSAIVTQMEENGERLAEVVRMITDIESKTRIINEIVFQTKLLSFNASVEAARAGDAGRGFAVVAEEVAKLAALSGNAAKDISTSLQANLQKVESISTETKRAIEGVTVQTKARLDGGLAAVDECKRAFERVVTSVAEVGNLVDEISTATGEQNRGVQEITRAMQGLGQVVVRNEKLAQGAADASEGLMQQAGSVSHVVTSLRVEIQGTQRATERQTQEEGPQHGADSRGDGASRYAA